MPLHEPHRAPRNTQAPVRSTFAGEQVEGTRISEDSGNQLDFCVAENQLSYHSVLLVTQNETVRVSGTAIMSKNK